MRKISLHHQSHNKESEQGDFLTDPLAARFTLPAEWFSDVDTGLEKEVEDEIYEGEKPPALPEGELAALDFESDRKELDRLVNMGVLRLPEKGEGPYAV